ncbi:hypothetical protein HN903_02545 [archaeon]|jgi:hypothetical protein|nr:hypothetical protein [archaeon]MBT7128611.1 hypothetical protein [archaeon]
MALNNNYLGPGEVLEIVEGLKRDKLAYWTNKNYIPREIEQRGKRDYTYYHKKDIKLIQNAYQLIVVGGMKDKEAFERLKKSL